MEYEVFIKAILSSCDSNLIVKCRERNDLEYKESFGLPAQTHKEATDTIEHAVFDEI